MFRTFPDTGRRVLEGDTKADGIIFLWRDPGTYWPAAAAGGWVETKHGCHFVAERSHRL